MDVTPQSAPMRQPAAVGGYGRGRMLTTAQARGRYYPAGVNAVCGDSLAVYCSADRLSL